MGVKHSVLQILLVLLHLSIVTKGNYHAPCHGCRLYNIIQREQPFKQKQESALCHYPCQCAVQELRCNEGVSHIKDGCNCCFMCARQRGDLCSTKDKCDTSAGLFCDMTNNKTGICQAKIKKPCIVNGIKYEDGQEFQPECRRTCTCQNGFYGCVNRCPQEENKPKDMYCVNPVLLSVAGKCCKEWTCDNRYERQGWARDSPMVPESQNLVLQQPLKDSTTKSPKLEYLKTKCMIAPSNWSACSASCGVGTSVRIVADAYCSPKQERRVCYIRPCIKELRTYGRSKCTPTTRGGIRQRIQYQDCRSVKTYNLKFCTNCKLNRCCYPHKSRTRLIEFECHGGRREYMNYMWIKKCRCDHKCYEPEPRKRHTWL
ncbi:CCN family member 2 isoform X2 [Patella vulgata]|uniref:CCN family member 2 isoform X2 n=1 Tax=Patella vulgata TaxID=6465 RepID=UPI002180278E|nr:CCN family member 2 isoform X2 [Patella vulgata]